MLLNLEYDVETSRFKRKISCSKTVYHVAQCFQSQDNIHSIVFSLEGRAWQEPEISHVTGVALAHCILGKFLGVVFHCFTRPLDVPTLAARCLRLQRHERS